MRLIDLDEAIKAMDDLEQEDIEAYGCKIPEGFDSERPTEALNSIPTIQAVPIEVLDKIKDEIYDLDRDYIYDKAGYVIDERVPYYDVIDIIDKYTKGENL